MKLRYRLLLALASGSASYLVFPRPGIWPLIFPIVAAFYLSIANLKFWRGTLVGLVAGSAFYVSHIYWISQYLGPEPLVALAGLQAIIFAFGLGLAGWSTRKLSALLSGHRLKVALSFAFAAIWTAREYISTHYPYGGFPWSRLAMTQTNSVLGNWVFYGGMPLATFVIAFAAVALLLFSRSQRTKLRVIAVASITGALFLPAILAPLSNSAEGGSIRIASIQGNANAGLFSNSARGTFLMHHIDEARKFLATGEDFDVMVWPENSADIDVLGSETDRLVISNFVNNELHRPLIFGTITKRDGEYFNSSLYWLPGSEMADWYDKQRPVPFAEYVPDREFWRKISSLVDMVPIGYSFGTRDGIFISDHGRLGTLICFEIAVDEIPRTLVSDGAQLILSQTNNADFGHSDEAFQQLGIARLRAIETGRAVINVSTVGPSAVILPSGELAQYVSEFKPGFMSFDVPLRDSRTPAQFISLPFDLANLGLTVIGVIFLTLAPRIRGRSA